MLTPVSIYLRLREQFKNTVLLESSDYHGDEHNFSYICFGMIAGYRLENNVFLSFYPDGQKEHIQTNSQQHFGVLVNQFIKQFETPSTTISDKIMTNALFGYMTYDVIEQFEDIQLRHEKPNIPTAQYYAYQYIIAFNHFNHELYIIKNDVEGIESKYSFSLDAIEIMIKSNAFELCNFKSTSKKNFKCR